VLHESPLLTGLIIAPQGVVGFCAGVIGPRLAGTMGVRRLLVLTAAAAAAGFLVLTRLPATGYSPVLFVVTLIGFGTAGTALGSTVLASAGCADSDQGLVGGMINTSRQIGAAVGAALLPTAPRCSPRRWPRWPPPPWPGAPRGRYRPAPLADHWYRTGRVSAPATGSAPPCTEPSATGSSHPGR